MKKLILSIVVSLALPAISFAGSLTGTITQVFAGQDQWYGVRFYLDISNNQANGECNTTFVYTEPDAGSGHSSKVAVFTAAYLSGKTVTMTVVSGRGGYCKLVEGSMY